jgi:hypothetical protein
MEKSWKNILQEYCQKNELIQPTYNTHKIGTTEHNQIIWQSVIAMNDLKSNSTDTTKKGAECGAAALMYLLLKETQEINFSSGQNIGRNQKIKQVQDINFKLYNRILLIDGENCDFDMNKLEKNDLVIIFVAKNTTKNIVFKFQDKYDNVFVFISQCVGQDAADHLLTFTAGILSVIFSEGKYWVLTKDHYGQSLEKFMKNCKFICSLDEL